MKESRVNMLMYEYTFLQRIEEIFCVLTEDLEFFYCRNSIKLKKYLQWSCFNWGTLFIGSAADMDAMFTML